MNENEKEENEKNADQGAARNLILNPALDAERIAEINAIADSARKYDKPFTETTWSQVLPGLYQGGTDDHDVIYTGRRYGAEITKDDFDLVVTMYAVAMPVDWWVQEIRYAIHDGDMEDIDMDDLQRIVIEAHRQWVSGRRVLIRCQAGWNRSGLVMALVLMRSGFTADEAIHLVRRARGSRAMCNPIFEQWLRQADLAQWRS